MTIEQLDKIEKLAEAATPGPWSQEVWQGNNNTGGWAAVGPHQESTDCICEGEEDRTACDGEFCADERSENDEEQAWKDAAFIRAMRAHALPLVKALREAWEARDAAGYSAAESMKLLMKAEKERDEARADRDDTLAVLARVAEQLDVSADALAEDPTLTKRRVAGLLSEFVGESIDVAFRAKEDRDAARAEVEMLRGVGCGEPSFIGAEIPDGPCGACLKCARRERDEARAEVDRMKAELAESEERRLGWAKEVGRLAAQRANLRAEVERLREVLRQVQALAWTPTMEASRQIRELTKEYE